LAQRLVRERFGRWLDRRSVVVDLGFGSNPLRDLPCDRVVGIDRHGVNGGLVGDSADTGLPGGEADFVVMSLSMWGTPADRLSYLREAKRLLRRRWRPRRMTSSRKRETSSRPLSALPSASD
jgi:hypothetical protein